MSGFASYEIARSGLFVNERGLYVTGQNISNVNTPGYVRQQAMIATAPYQNVNSKYGMYQIGLGADIQQIRQIRHSFLDNIYRQESTTLGYWEAKNKTFEDVQAILAEPMNSGLQDTMNQFWDSWQELSKEPDSLTVRALVAQRGSVLVEQINHIGAQLDKLQDDLNSEIEVRINEINDITRQIAKLNVEIMKVEVSGDTANDYRDQRNALVDKLSKLVSADVMEMQDGQLDITVGGYYLVQKGVQTDLYAGKTTDSGLFYVPMLSGTNIQVPIRGGTLKGLLESRGEVYGSKGSMSNGSPYNAVDLIFAISSDASAQQKADIISTAQAALDNFTAKGIKVNLGYVVYDDSGICASSPSYINDIITFSNDINAISGINIGTKGLDALKFAEGFPFGNNDLKHFVLVTSPIDGTLMDTTVNSVDSIIGDLQSLGISASVIGPTGGALEGQLEQIATSTGSSYFDPADATIPTDIYTEMKDDIYNNILNTQNIIADIRNQLNLLINVMARELNSIHRSGQTLNGQPGQDFFVPINGAYPLEMGNIKLNDNLNDLNNIVSSATGEKGDNTIALSIANLRYTSLIGKTGATVSLDDFYRSIISYVGNKGNDAATICDNQQKLVQSADLSRQSITGVSMDEEMTNMMKYKFAYDAASRVINVIDIMMGTIIEKMGITGR